MPGFAHASLFTHPLTLALMFCLSGSASQAQQSSIPERTELVYFIGEVVNLSQGLATVTLGDVHTLSVVEPDSDTTQHLAVFRSDGPVMRPVGAVPVRYVGTTFSQVDARRPLELQKGDVVMFVRQLDELRNGPAQEDHSLRRAMTRKRPIKGRTSVERSDMAQLLSAYKAEYPKWQRSTSKVAGYFFGRPRDTMTEDLKRLLLQIDLFREYHADGFPSIAAAGEVWKKTMAPVLGKDAIVKHTSATNVQDDPNGDSGRPLDLLKLDRTIKEQFFDSTEQEQALAGFLTATALRVQPRNLDDWLITRFPKTQYPQWESDSSVVERIRRAQRIMEANN